MSVMHLKPPANVGRILKHAMREYHPGLDGAGARVLAVMIQPELDKDGVRLRPAMRKDGHPIIAKIRVATPVERLLIGCDAVVLIDAWAWEQLDDPKRLALLDHELCHIIPRTKNDVIERHSDKRPVLQTVPHDWHITGFAAVIERHGVAALEYEDIFQTSKYIQGLLFDEHKPAGDELKVVHG